MNCNQNGILNPKVATRAEFAAFSHDPALSEPINNTYLRRCCGGASVPTELREMKIVE